jgi:hypothetical protein
MPILNLFKYYAPKFEDAYNLDFYTRGEIYFQNPSKFNDPWDCNAACITIPRQLKSLQSIYFNIVKRNDEDIAKLNWQQFCLLPRAEMKRRLLGLFTNVIELQRSKIGVFSLSFIPDSELMWSHYGLKHTGYVLHFQIDMNQYAEPSLKDKYTPILVKYCKNRLDWNLENYFSDKSNHVHDLIRYKSAAWSYECELRLLNVHAGGFFKIPKNWLKSIIMGIKIDDELRVRLIDAGNNLNLPVWQASMNDRNYKVDIHGLEYDTASGGRAYRELLDSKYFELQ